VDANDTLKDAVDIGQAATLMFTLQFTSLTHVLCGNYAAAISQCNELIILANKKDSLYRKALGMNHEGCVLALTGQASEAIHMITSGITVARSTGAKIWMPLCCLIWRVPMRNSVNSMMPGAALAKRSQL
jgi:hypothetical protein